MDYNKLKIFLRLLRVKQYTKNLMLFIPIVFAREIFHTKPFFHTALAFLGFCLITSSTYILNDIIDAPKDRLHPKKKNRPIAKGDISIKTASVVGIFLFVVGSMLVIKASILAFGMSMVYVLNSFVYSFYFKKKQLFDVFFIAFGFLIRVYIGAFASSVDVSPYLFLDMFFISLYLGFGKRRYELFTMEEKSQDFKEVLKYYSVYYLDQLMVISATLSLGIYAMYTLSVPSKIFFYSVIIATFGIFRYYHITHNLKSGEPSEELLNDKLILLSAVLLVLYDGVILYFHF
ncbi:MAG: UbiA prenyltransferase family protein [Hydrogenobaculum sp.]|nr:MAG: prenyltransferase [Hydrogenobaculum sp.]